MDFRIRGNIRNAQIPLASMPPAPLMGHCDDFSLQDIHFEKEFPLGTSTPDAQQEVLHLSDVPQWGPSRERLHQTLHFEGIDNRDCHGSCYVHSNQIAPLCQQCYPSHFLRRNSGNRDRGPSGSPGNGEHYPHQSGGRCGGLHGVPGGSDGGLPDNLYETGSDSSSSLELGKRQRYPTYSKA